MEYFSQLLLSAFKELADDHAAKILALTSCHPTMAEHPTLGELPFGFSSDLLPEKCEHQHIDPQTAFFAEVLDEIEAKSPAFVFLFPPFLHHGQRSASPRDLEEFCEKLFIGSDSQQPTLSAFVHELKPHGKDAVRVVALLLPREVLVSKCHARWRTEYFFPCGAVIIEHKHMWLGEAIGLGHGDVVEDLCTVILSRKSGPIHFYEVPADVPGDLVPLLLSDFEGFLSVPGYTSRAGCILEAADYQGDAPCCFEYYSPKTLRLLKQASEMYGAKIPLHSIVRPLSGIRSIMQGRNDSGENGVLILTQAAIQENGDLSLDQARQHERPIIVQNYLQDGDICLRRIYPDTDAIYAGVYRSDGRAISFGGPMIVLRPHTPLSKEHESALLNYFKSQLAIEIMRARQIFRKADDHWQLSQRHLLELPVPSSDTTP